MKEKTRETKLNERETEIIKLLSQGYGDEEIAAAIGKTYYSVRNDFMKLLMKTGTVNRPHLVSWAYRHGVLGQKL